MSEDMTQKLPGSPSFEERVLAELAAIRLGQAALEDRMTNFETRLTALEDKVERRLQDTRPIWEQVLTRLTEVEERLTKRIKKVEDEVFLLRRKFDNWTGDVALVRMKQEDLEERFEEFKAEGSK